MDAKSGPGSLSVEMRLAIPLCALLVLLCLAGGARAQSSPGTEPLIYSVKGPELYRAYCASCHGLNGRGDGPSAPALRTMPADLTLLSRENHGQFPTARVRKVITGDEPLKSHGSREMPIWGPIFHRIEYDQDLGKVRIDNLLKYLLSIQRK